MQFNKFIARVQNTALFGLIAAMAACQSDSDKLNKLDSEIDDLDTKIENARTQNEATDSIARNPMLAILNSWIIEDRPHIDSLRTRNQELSERVRKNKLNRLCNKYPLSLFLSSEELSHIQSQLRHGYKHNDEKSANRILNGYGSLQDLYNLSFYLANEGQPFYVIDQYGTVRFDDEYLDSLCRRYDDEKWAISTTPQTNREIEANQAQIKEFENKCKINDSIYSEIEAKFQPQISNRIDSLKKIRADKYQQRKDLVAKIKAVEKAKSKTK